MKLTDKDTGSERQRHPPKITQFMGSRSPDFIAGQVQVLPCLTISLFRPVQLQMEEATEENTVRWGMG